MRRTNRRPKDNMGVIFLLRKFVNCRTHYDALPQLPRWICIKEQTLYEVEESLLGRKKLS